jgi:hypothetical protein
MKKLLILASLLIAGACTSGPEQKERKLTELEKLQNEARQRLDDDIASGQCIERRMAVVSKFFSSRDCGWEPQWDGAYIGAGETEPDEAAKKFIASYPSWKICGCMRKKWAEKIPEQIKKDMTAKICIYKYDTNKWEKSEEYKRYEEFRRGLWNECDKEVPRWVDDVKNYKK